MTLAYLGTIVGMTATVLLIVQYTKPMKWIKKIDTRVYVLILSVVLSVIVNVFVNNDDLLSYFLCLVNAFIVATSAMGSYQISFASSDAAKKAALNDGGAVSGE